MTSIIGLGVSYIPVHPRTKHTRYIFRRALEIPSTERFSSPTLKRQASSLSSTSASF
jgi:hypothetical protein